MWDKKVHVKSSLDKKDGQWSLFIGRWQPLHDGHKELFRQVINDGGKVLVAVRDVPIDGKNPFTAESIMENIYSEMMQEATEGKIRVIIIPDICSVNFGRGVGYDIVEYVPPKEIHDISATKIREQMRAEGRL